MFATNRPFRVLGIQQIAIGGLDKGALSDLWTGLFGIPKIGDYKSEARFLARIGHRETNFGASYAQIALCATFIGSWFHSSSGVHALLTLTPARPFHFPVPICQ